MNLTEARIMVVDDDAVMRKYVVSALGKLGVHNVEECADGAAAMKLVGTFWPDLVLTDIHMDPVGGLEFVRQLRDHPAVEFRKVRVIFMSADSSTSTLEEAMPLGTHGYIVKPPRPETLRAKLEQALKS
jgi:CheY-like chemotaxis protein